MYLPLGLPIKALSAEQIATRVDLPKGEIEFIAKVNRDQLTFNEEELPVWAEDAGKEERSTIPSPALGTMGFAGEGEIARPTFRAVSRAA